MIVRIALEEIGAAYETRLVDRGAGAQRSAAYLKINPNGKIPALETPEGILFETGAILLWLAAKHNALAPSPAAPQYGEFLKWHIFCTNTVHPGLRMLFYPHYFVGTDVHAQRCLMQSAQSELRGALQILDTHQVPSGALTVTDIYISACLRWCAIYGPDDRSWFSLDDTPRLKQMAAQLEQRPSVLRVSTLEGLGPNPFTKPVRPNPPEGSAI